MKTNVNWSIRTSSVFPKVVRDNKTMRRRDSEPIKPSCSNTPRNKNSIGDSFYNKIRV